MSKRVLSNHWIAVLLVILAGVGVALVFLIPSRIHGPGPGDVGADARVPPPRAEAPAADKAALVEARNRFAVNLYGRLREGPGNLFFSPYSAAAALEMTWAGARGPTADQFAAVLRLPAARLDRPQGVLAAAAALAYDLHAAGNADGGELALANRLWGGKGEDLLPDFQALMKTYYGADMAEADFGRDVAGARRSINRWVAGQTRGRIVDLANSESLDGDTVLVLVSAAYFKGDWAAGFDVNKTRPGAFQVSPEQKVAAEMMQPTEEGAFRMFRGQGFGALEMPYKGGALAMLVLLPDEVGGLADLERTLSADALAQCVRGLERRQGVALTFPKFKMSQRLNLAGVLLAMGMPLAFDPKQADFSGLSATQSLFLRQAIHQAFVEVNEVGTIAAAAALHEIAKSAGMPHPTIFSVDHPFLFLIRDTRTGAILFMGRVVDPTQ
jgi:serpin B